MTHEVFINYRTGDGDQIATLIEENLGNRFGSERIFRDKKSIDPGTPYQPELIDGVRNCKALVAVIGPGWSQRRELYDPDDWVRREIREALGYAIPIIPVLVGRGTTELDGELLPPDIARLADHQWIHLDLATKDADLRRLGDALVKKVPSLRSVDKLAQPEVRDDANGNSLRGVKGGAMIQGSEITGNVIQTHLGSHQGPLHIGPQKTNYSPHFHGSGGRFIAGDDRSAPPREHDDTSDEDTEESR